MTIDAVVTGQKLVADFDDCIVSGAINYYEIRFVFSADWNNLKKIAVLEDGTDRRKFEIMCGRIASVDFTLRKGTNTLSVYGYADGMVKRITTNSVTFEVL